jgi:hypothetical protein
LRRRRLRRSTGCRSPLTESGRRLVQLRRQIGALVENRAGEEAERTQDRKEAAELDSQLVELAARQLEEEGQRERDGNYAEPLEDLRPKRWHVRGGSSQVRHGEADRRQRHDRQDYVDEGERLERGSALVFEPVPLEEEREEEQRGAGARNDMADVCSWVVQSSFLPGLGGCEGACTLTEAAVGILPPRWTSGAR